MGRATFIDTASDRKHVISIHALRGEGDYVPSQLVGIYFEISIHALRGEGDRNRIIRYAEFFRISIHALRGEGDVKRAQKQ